MWKKGQNPCYSLGCGAGRGYKWLVHHSFIPWPLKLPEILEMHWVDFQKVKILLFLENMCFSDWVGSASCEEKKHKMPKCSDCHVLVQYTSLYFTLMNGTAIFQCPLLLLCMVDWFYGWFTSFELPHDKTNKMARVLSKDSDQPGYPPSLIRVFALCMKKAWVFSYPLSTQWRRWSDWTLADQTVILLVLTWGGSFFHCLVC